MENKEVIKTHVDKIRVSSAEIVINKNMKKPYYEIKYFDLSDNVMHVGYSSYDIEYVLQWLKECFDIVNVQALEENDKLKAEIEQLREEVSGIDNHVAYYNSFKEYRKLYRESKAEIEQLKSELEQAKSKPIFVTREMFDKAVRNE